MNPITPSEGPQNAPQQAPVEQRQMATMGQERAQMAQAGINEMAAQLQRLDVEMKQVEGNLQQFPEGTRQHASLLQQKQMLANQIAALKAQIPEQLPQTRGEELEQNMMKLAEEIKNENDTMKKFFLVMRALSDLMEYVDRMKTSRLGEPSLKKQKGQQATAETPEEMRKKTEADRKQKQDELAEIEKQLTRLSQLGSRKPDNPLSKEEEDDYKDLRAKKDQLLADKKRLQDELKVSDKVKEEVKESGFIDTVYAELQKAAGEKLGDKFSINNGKEKVTITVKATLLKDVPEKTRKEIETLLLGKGFTKDEKTGDYVAVREKK